MPHTALEPTANRSHGVNAYVLISRRSGTPSTKEDSMSEETRPEAADTEAEDFEVVAHSDDDEEQASGCAINNSHALN